MSDVGVVPVTGTRPVVDDGAPCPVHGEPSRRCWVQGIGAFSQCWKCRDEFLEWYASHIRDVYRGGPELAPVPLRPQVELL